MTLSQILDAFSFEFEQKTTSSMFMTKRMSLLRRRQKQLRE